MDRRKNVVGGVVGLFRNSKVSIVLNLEAKSILWLVCQGILTPVCKRYDGYPDMMHRRRFLQGAAASLLQPLLPAMLAEWSSKYDRNPVK